MKYSIVSCNQKMPWKFCYLISEGISRVKVSKESSTKVLSPTLWRWKFIELPIWDIITCASEQERVRARYRRTFRKSWKGNNSDRKTTGSFRFDGSPSFSRCRATWAIRYHSDQFKVIRFAGHFRVPEGRQRYQRCPDLGKSKCGLIAIIVLAIYFYWWKTWLANF